jgi:ABC-type dipeptide/oligopeptide/nickel transport system permease component
VKREGQVWPPPPKYQTETSETPPPRRQKKGCLAAASVIFITFLAFFIGLGAGLGHKDFSESLLSNIGLALFDVALWVLAILYWLEVARAHWRTLKQKPTPLKYMGFALFVGVLAALYGAGIYISLFCLIARAGASDTTL